MAYEKLIVSKSVLVNLGDYQNEKIEMQLEYTIEPGETPESAHEQVSEQFKALLIKELEPTLAHLPGWRRDMWLDLLGIPKPEPIGDDNPKEPVLTQRDVDAAIAEDFADEPNYQGENFTNPDGEPPF